MRAFGTASRLRLLWAMLGGERTVDELARATDLGASVTSHQLRLLRHGRLLAGCAPRPSGPPPLPPPPRPPGGAARPPRPAPPTSTSTRRSRSRCRRKGPSG